MLDGDGLTLAALKIDGAPLPPEQYVATADRLTIAQPPQQPFRLEIETVVDPSANTQLMGLYRSGPIYCTQCEAEGFRRITYFPDRPDVMAVYTTRIEAEKADAPVLLANGNLISSGDLPGTTRHFAVWHDPFPKPSYLFALVGGKLACVDDSFTTMSGRKVALKIYVEPGKEARCAYAMDSLKRAMRWDETAFGREYDLDIFMIVAVSDFNMGAMENKGLNVFNDKYVLASPETATDTDFERIEAIIAHEYFHNWTGNRITCRDWFQLCLKEGLTVFRDEEFTADERSRAVERIGDVRGLRAHQFVEDAGPLAHPVRPRALSRDQQFLHGDRVREGRRGRAHDQGAARAREFPQGYGPLFHPPRRRGGDHRAVRAMLRRCLGRGPHAIHALVQPGRHARGRRHRQLRRAGEDLSPRRRADRAGRPPASRARSRWSSRSPSASSAATGAICRSRSPTGARSSAACSP